MDLSGLSAIAPGYLDAQALQAQTLLNQNAGRQPAALAAILQALGSGQGPASLGQPLAPQQVQPGREVVTVGPVSMGGQFPPGPNPNPQAMFTGNDTPSQMAPGGPDMRKFDWMFSGNGMAPQPGYGRYQELQPASPPPGDAAPAASQSAVGRGGGATPPPPAAPNLPPQTRQALYQMPLEDIVKAIKKGNPKIDDNTLGLGLQALAPFLNRQAQLDLQEQRLQYSQENAALRNEIAVQRLDQAASRLDPETQANLSAARRAGTVSAMEEPAAREAVALIDNAVAQSNNVPREQWKFANQILQAGEGQMNDPKLASLNAALFGVVNTYARAIAGVTGRGPTVNDKKHAEAVLSAVQSQEAFKAAADQLKYEVEVARDAAARNRATVTGGSYNQAPPVAPMPGTVTSEPVVIDGYTITPR